MSTFSPLILSFPAKLPKSRFFKTPLTNNHKRSAHALNLFDEIPHRDISSLNSLLASYVRNNDALAAWALFRRMHLTRSDLDAYTFTPILGACSTLQGSELGKQVHSLLTKTGSGRGAVTKTALMDMYSKCGNLGDSVKVFEEMEFKDVVTWNALLSSFLRQGLAVEALGVFEAMRKEGIGFSESTLCSVLKACGYLKALRLVKQIHGLVVVMAHDLVVLGTALIDFYSNVGYIDEAWKVFSSLDCEKDTVILNSLISGCLRNRKYKEAFSIMTGMKPNVIALTSALAACSENSDLWIGKQIHCVAIRFGFTSDTQLCNVLLDMYAKCGKILIAQSLFDKMCNKDVVSWTSMIDAHGSHGHGVEALELFTKMGEEGEVLPNSVTFLVVLSACGHSGLVEEGRRCFKMATEKYGLDLQPEHYACLIDILGRSGDIEEVWCLFNEMVKNGAKPTGEVWTALLNACSLNLDAIRGEFAAKNLLELEGNRAPIYVLLSNIYAAVGKWDCVNELRSVVRKKGLVKEAGSSWVTVSGCQENDINLSTQRIVA